MINTHDAGGLRDVLNVLEMHEINPMICDMQDIRYVVPPTDSVQTDCSQINFLRCHEEANCGPGKRNKWSSGSC